MIKLYKALTITTIVIFSSTAIAFMSIEKENNFEKQTDKKSSLLMQYETSTKMIIQ
ncbi:hypothetical protein OAO18_07650 [Francisellaceae bacterium]|nr:hypothetical protein [Francisellaceae bacterium]